jgi:hypothetical protein
MKDIIQQTHAALLLPAVVTAIGIKEYSYEKN